MQLSKLAGQSNETLTEIKHFRQELAQTSVSLYFS